jgi:hypothetical protein
LHIQLLIPGAEMRFPRSRVLFGALAVVAVAAVAVTAVLLTSSPPSAAAYAIRPLALIPASALTAGRWPAAMRTGTSGCGMSPIPRGRSS